ncbi:MAG: PilZ domain-containing protein [Candidatus Omnitrophica bacterium]|nr:PilZ domain-containing protein [Candidatus Omnitrophota bacterium]
MNFLYKFRIFDRRKAKRYEVFPPIKCICSSSDLGYEGILSYILVVSKIGLLFSVDKFQFPRLSSIKIQFQLPDNQEIFSINGIIVRTQMSNM